MFCLGRENWSLLSQNTACASFLFPAWAAPPLPVTQARSPAVPWVLALASTSLPSSLLVSPVTKNSAKGEKTTKINHRIRKSIAATNTFNYCLCYVLLLFFLLKNISQSALHPFILICAPLLSPLLSPVARCPLSSPKASLLHYC